MERTLEPELMDDPDQALAYARADFAEENAAFVRMFLEYYPDVTEGTILDLGCGPADIPIRLARALPGVRVIAVDASKAMIDLGRAAVSAAGVADRVELRCQRIQELTLTVPADAVISNSLLHHIPNPLQFWFAMMKLGQPGAPVLVMDLFRPDSPEAAQSIVDRYAHGDAPILRRDFYHSLLAAFTEDEVAAQLAEMNLSRLLIDVVDDRHLIVAGRLPGTR